MNSNHNQLVCVCKEVFLAFDGRPSKDWFITGSAVMLVTLAAIVIGIVSAVLSTNPNELVYPVTCAKPVCDHDALCPNRTICEPFPDPAYDILGAVVTIIFVIDYFVRLLTLWACTARQADLIPHSWYETHKPGDHFPEYSTQQMYSKFIFSFRNLVDIAAILPYALLHLGVTDSINSNFVRILRLVRFLGLMNRHHIVKTMLSVVLKTLRQSAYALMVLVFISIIGVVFFASVLYACEQGVFQVTTEYPDGIYLRQSWKDGHQEMVPTPFNSVSTAIYAVIATITTVGYGDLTPTTPNGRAVACIMMYWGVVLLALPIGVISSTFNRIYNEVMTEVESRKITLDKQVWTYFDEYQAFDVALTQDTLHKSEFPRHSSKKYLALDDNITSKEAHNTHEDIESQIKPTVRIPKEDPLHDNPSRYVQMALEYAKTGKPSNKTIPVDDGFVLYPNM